MGNKKLSSKIIYKNHITTQIDPNLVVTPSYKLFSNFLPSSTGSKGFYDYSFKNTKYPDGTPYIREHYGSGVAAYFNATYVNVPTGLKAVYFNAEWIWSYIDEWVA